MKESKDTKRFRIILSCSMALYGSVFFGVIFDAIGRQDLAELMKYVTLLLICGDFRYLSKQSGNGMASLSLMVLSLFWGITTSHLIFALTCLAMDIYSSAVAPEGMYGMGLIELFAGLMRLGLLRLCVVAGLMVFGLFGSFVSHYLFVCFKDDGIIQ